MFNIYCSTNLTFLADSFQIKDDSYSPVWEGIYELYLVINH